MGVSTHNLFDGHYGPRPLHSHADSGKQTVEEAENVQNQRKYDELLDEYRRLGNCQMANSHRLRLNRLERSGIWCPDPWCDLPIVGVTSLMPLTPGLAPAL